MVAETQSLTFLDRDTLKASANIHERKTPHEPKVPLSKTFIQERKAPGELKSPLSRTFNILNSSNSSNFLHEDKSDEELKALVEVGDLDACVEVLKRCGATTFHVESQKYNISLNKLASQALAQLQDGSSPQHEALSYLIRANIAYNERKFGLAGVFIGDLKSLQYPEKFLLIEKEKCFPRMREELKIKRQVNPRVTIGIHRTQVETSEVINAAQCKIG